MKKRCDVLVLIWGMIGRDVEALIPIIFLLKKKYKLSVKVKSLFNSTAIDFYNPKILLVNGCNGSNKTFKITKYAKERGIHVVSLHAEGMFKKTSLESCIIGWNKTWQPTVDKWYLWNSQSYQWANNEYPQFKDVLDVAGSTLHEKYKIFKNNDFNNLLVNKNKYKQIILYSGWGFDIAKKLAEQDRIKKNVIDYKNKVTNYLKLLIEKYTDVLFVLKYHPATIDEENTEINSSFSNFENVIILKNEIPFYQLLLQSDLVITFDSTTVIDAWLAGKTTISLYDGKRTVFQNKSFGYSDLRACSIVPENESDLLQYFDKYYKANNIIEFDNKELLRKKTIKEYIGDIDRKPSLKIAEYIFSSINKKNPQTRKINLKLIKKGLKNIIFYYIKFLPASKKYTGMRNYYKPKMFRKQYSEFSRKLPKYYNL